MSGPSLVLSLPHQSPGFRLLLRSLVCGLGSGSHQVLLLFRILLPQRCSSRAGWEPLGPGHARPCSIQRPDWSSPPGQTPLRTPRLLAAYRIKPKPYLPAAHLSKGMCHSLREPSAAFRHPYSSLCSLQIGLFLLDLNLSYFLYCICKPFQVLGEVDGL